MDPNIHWTAMKRIKATTTTTASNSVQDIELLSHETHICRKEEKKAKKQVRNIGIKSFHIKSMVNVIITRIHSHMVTENRAKGYRWFTFISTCTMNVSSSLFHSSNRYLWLQKTKKKKWQEIVTPWYKCWHEKKKKPKRFLIFLSRRLYMVDLLCK